MSPTGFGHRYVAFVSCLPIRSNSLHLLVQPLDHVRHKYVRMQSSRFEFASMRVVFLLISLLIVLVRSAPNLLHDGHVVSADVFESLEELARIVDISYCVGSTGIQKPFKCLSRCHEFQGFELVKTWNTGPLLSDSCGYVAISHAPFEERVLVVFRGTYSIANTIADLSTRHAEYSPFPAGNDTRSFCADPKAIGTGQALLSQTTGQHSARSIEEPQCQNCTVHSGFLTSWQNTRCMIIPEVEMALEQYPGYKLVLVGHSLGGAVATIAALDFQARGYKPFVTTFGEPRIGNKQFNKYIDDKFNLNASGPHDALFRRVTHIQDPVPLLPLQEWGYEMHAGEIFISKASLPPRRDDVYTCDGDADPACIAGENLQTMVREGDVYGAADQQSLGWKVPNRYKLWELFFAHRDYFWRLGLCMPGGDPWDWNRVRTDNVEQDSDDIGS